MMSKLSIYQKSWNELVFEGKNKEYGAYQLRQQAFKTTTLAFVFGLLFVASCFGIVTLLSSFGTSTANTTTIPIIDDEALHVTDVRIKDIHPPSTAKPSAIEPPQPTEISPEKLLSNPMLTDVTQAQNVSSNNEVTTIATSSENGNTSGTATTTNTNLGTTTAGTTNIPFPDTTVRIAATLDKLPEFPGGIDKFYLYVSTHFNNPETDEVKILKVYVSFVIEKDGSMTDIQVKRDPGYGLGKEAIRVLKSLKTKWEPGLVNNKPVRTAYNLPITLKIQ